MSLLALFVLIMVVNGVGQALLKKAAIGVTEDIRSRAVKLLLGYLCSAAVVCLNIILLDIRDVRYLIFIVALNYAFVSLIGKFYFKEKLSTYNWIGVFLIVLGVVIGKGHG